MTNNSKLKTVFSRRRFIEKVAAGALGVSGLVNLRSCMPTQNPPSDKLILYVGTYTNRESKGIYKFSFDKKTGLVEHGTLIAPSVNPSFLAVHPSGNWLYAVNEVTEFDGEQSGAVSAFSIAPETGELLLLNQKPSKGGAPCHISVDASGKWALVANYLGGNVAVFPIQEGGVLGDAVSVVNHEGSSVNERRQEAPHAHSINMDPANQHAIVADLGIDRVMAYDLNADTGVLTPAPAPFAAIEPGAGPRHFAFHPSGDYAFVINELNSTMSSLKYNAETGEMTTLATVSTLPAAFEGNNSCADIHVSPDGRFVYGSNRGHNSIVIASFDDQSGALEVVGHESTRGETPRNFNLDPAGKFLLVANQNSDSIFVFRRDQETGLLTSTGQHIEAPEPVCLVFA